MRGGKLQQRMEELSGVDGEDVLLTITLSNLDEVLFPLSWLLVKKKRPRGPDDSESE